LTVISLGSGIDQRDRFALLPAIRLRRLGQIRRGIGGERGQGCVAHGRGAHEHLLLTPGALGNEPRAILRLLEVCETQLVLAVEHVHVPATRDPMHLR